MRTKLKKGMSLRFKNTKSLEEKVRNILDYHNIILSGLKFVIVMMRLLRKLIPLKIKYLNTSKNQF